MKNSSTYERRFKALLGKLRKAFTPAMPANLPTDPTTELIWSVLLEDSPEGSAKVGMSRLTGHFVDYNELRVSRPEEIVEALPNTLSDPKSRANRIIRSLQAIFDKFDTLVITELRDHGKREARNFVAAVPEMTAFVEGRVCLFSLGIHSIPTDATLMGLLRDHGAVHPETDVRDTQGFLERVVPAKDAIEVALLLEALRQEPGKLPAPAREKAPPAPREPKPARPAVGAARKAPASARKSGGKKK
ncbi:MAG: hypothetical protein PHU85_03845 [Phycisphaerae bacterium]|nr:hypothetical protein [Phycisphaerae bacterium]